MSPDHSARHHDLPPRLRLPHRPDPGSPSARTRPPPPPWASTASRAKLIAFALGATLAGLAGTVSAHVTYSDGAQPVPVRRSGPAQLRVPPRRRQSSRGMGTVSGPFLGARPALPAPGEARRPPGQVPPRLRHRAHRS
ncbi:hypothetical protein ACRAWF_23995 [Streptomyces sp. L7]